MSEVTPLPANPTNADLATAIGQLHVCFDTETKITRKEISNLRLGQVRTASAIRKMNSGIIQARAVTSDSVQEIKDQVDLIVQEQKKVKDELGVEKQKKSVGIMSQTRLVFTIISGATAAGAVWRFIEFMAPTFLLFFKQLHTYVMK